MLSLLLVAHIRDDIQGHVENQDLDDAGVSRSNHLGHEHRPGRDLHVMAEFEIRNEIKRLGPEEGISKLVRDIDNYNCVFTYMVMKPNVLKLIRYVYTVSDINSC